MLSPSAYSSTAAGATSSRFLGLRLVPPPRSPATATPLPSPSSPSPLRSPGICAAYASAATAESTFAPGLPARPRTSTSSLYDVLGIPAGASRTEIKAAYRRLALECHPDMGAPADEFIRIQAAYSTLSDPDKRAEYDLALVTSAPPRTFAGGGHSWARPATAARGSGGGGYRTYARSSSFPGQSRRTWETEQCW